MRNWIVCLLAMGWPAVGVVAQDAGGVTSVTVDELRASSVVTDRVTVTRIDLKAGSESALASVPDEVVYHVLAGNATLRVGEQDHPVQAGALVCVPAGLPRQFVAVESELTVLAVVSLHPRTTGGIAAGRTPAKQTAYAEGSQRGSARVFYWYGARSAGQLAIDHGQPLWQPEYESFLRRPSGQRWRLGENFWTSLDTNMGLTIGGVAVPIGLHYLVLQHTSEAGVELVALDPHRVRQRWLDAYDAAKTRDGIAIPVTVTKSETVSPRLRFSLVVDPARENVATLTIRFGQYVLETPIVMQPRDY